MIRKSYRTSFSDIRVGDLIEINSAERVVSIGAFEFFHNAPDVSQWSKSNCRILIFLGLEYSTFTEEGFYVLGTDGCKIISTATERRLEFLEQNVHKRSCLDESLSSS